MLFAGMKNCSGGSRTDGKKIVVIRLVNPGGFPCAYLSCAQVTREHTLAYLKTETQTLPVCQPHLSSHIQKQ